MRRKILKKKYKTLCKVLLGGLTFLNSMFANPSTSNALPVEPATQNRINISEITSANGIMNITGIGNAFINWRDFSIAPGETVNFKEMTNMLNYVSAVNPSLIYGNINEADVKDFYIVNPNGILFGANSRVITENLFVSTRSLTENDIQNYVKYGNNPLDIAVDTSRINDGGIKSSQIIGAYDIADGDVMFLGKVQANSLKVEGNVIQIRNTANILNKEGTEKLTDVTLISDNNPEVGYNVTTEGVDVESAIADKETNSTAETQEVELFNPFTFDMSSRTGDLLTDGAKIELLIEQYNLDNNDENSWALQSVIDFFWGKINSSSSDDDVLRAEMALDYLIQQNISDGVLSWSSVSDSVWENAITVVTTPVSPASQLDAESLTNDAYKYFLADMIGDEKMPNSANYIGYKATKLDQTTTQTIDDYRLITSVYDLNQSNHSKYGSHTDGLPSEGYIHGKYMLANDLDLSSVIFKPLGYGMSFSDFESEDDMISFNGLNFTIKGLNTDLTVSDAQGLFSVFAGKIKNLRLTDVNIDATSNNNSAVGGLIGGLAGNEDMTTTIKNVSVNGEIKGNTYTGGLVGNTTYGAYSPDVLDDDYSTGGSDDYSVGGSDDYSAGGSDDYSTGGSDDYPTDDSDDPIITVRNSASSLIFENVENFAPIISTDSNNGSVGGLVGNAGGNVTVSNSMNQGEISGGETAGGILGHTSEDGVISLNKVANMGNVTASNNAGGLIGYSYYNSSILNSYNTGNVGTSNTNYSGGLAVNWVGTIKNSFNSGEVKANYGAAGFVISPNSYYNSDYKNIISDSYNSGNVTADDGSAYGISSTITNNIENVYNSGNVEGKASYSSENVTGIAGEISGNVTNVYNIGDITNNGTSGYTAGIAKSVDGNLINVYNTGKVSSNSTYTLGRYYYYGGKSGSSMTKYGTTAGIVNLYGGKSAENIFNFGEISSKGITAGLFNKTETTDSDDDEVATFKNLYNEGNISGISAAGILNVANSESTFDNVNNLGDITATGTNTSGSYAGDYAAGIMGIAQDEISLSNIYNYGEVKAAGYAAGIMDQIGYTKTVTFDNVYNFKDVTATKGAAGILRINVSSAAPADFKNIYNYGNVTSTAGLVSGILTSTSGTTTFENVYNFGDITTNGSSDESYASGILGITSKSNSFKDIYNYGDIKGLAAAGILRNSSSEPTSMENVYNYGDITSTGKTSNDDYAVGILGRSNGATTFENIYNYGKVSAENTYSSGVVKLMNKTSEATWKNIYNYGDVEGTSATGILWKTVGAIPMDGVYNFGNVTGKSGLAAGILGTSTSSTGTTALKNVYNFGNIDGSTSAAGIINATRADITLNLENVRNYGDVTANSSYAAGIYGQTTNSRTGTFTFKDIYNFGKIKSENSSAAGIIDYSYSPVTLTNAYNIGDVEGTSAAGILNSTKSQATFTDVYNFGNVTGNSDYAAGILDTTTSTVSFTNVFNKGEIKGNSAAGILRSSTSTSTNETTPAIKMENVQNEGNVTASSDYSAGIVGTSTGRATFNEVYNKGNVTSESSYAAGILGKTTSQSYFTNVHNYGKITAADNAAGILGITTGSQMNTVFENVYNLADITGGSAAGILNYAHYSGSRPGTNSPYVSMTNVHNFGDITATSTYAGGIGGDIYGNNNSIWQNVSNQGKVTGVTFAGGISYIKHTGYKSDVEIFQDVYNFGDVTATGDNGVASGSIAKLDESDDRYYIVLGNVFNGGKVTGATTYDIVDPSKSKGYNLLDSAEKISKPTEPESISDLTTPDKVTVPDKAAALENLESTVTPTLKEDALKTSLMPTESTSEVKVTLDEKVFDTTEQTEYVPSTTETVDNPIIDFTKVMSSIWEAFGADLDGSQVVDEDGNERTDTTWRVYPNYNNLTDKNRQPLLTQWMHAAEVTRYSQLKDDGEVKIISLLNPTFGMHGLHNSKGYAIDVRYKNSGQSALTEDGKNYYIYNPNFYGYDINESADGKTFYVEKNGVDLAEAFLYGTQFGYNFHFKENTEAWNDDDDTNSSSGDLVSDTPLTAPANNAVYLRVGNKDNVPDEPTDTEKPVDVTPSGTPSEVDPDDDTTTIDFSIYVGSGNYNKDNQNVTYTYTDSDGNHYRISNPSSADLSDFTITYEEIEVDDGEGGISHYTTAVKITYDGTEYSISKGNLTYNESKGNYTLTVTNDTTKTTYNITINPGEITSSQTMTVTVNVGDGKVDKNKDNEFTNEGYSADNTVINNLLTDVLEVVNKDDETTTVKIKDGVQYTATENDDGTTTYTVTKGGKDYTFTANSTKTVFTYVDDSDEDNIVTYNVTVNPGTITIYEEKTATINVNDGTVVDGTFSSNGYEIEGDDTVKNTFKNLTVVQSGDNTTVRLNVGSNLKYDSSTGKYTYTTTSGNKVTNYIIDIKPGDITQTNHAKVTIDVADGEVVDGGSLTVNGDKDYTVTGSDKIAELLTNVLEVVDDKNGGTMLQIRSDVVHSSTPNSDGTTTYKVTKNNVNYTFTQNTDGTFTYTDDTDSKNITIYNVEVNPGEITTYTNKTATIKLVDGKVADGDLTLQSDDGQDYTITGTGANDIDSLLSGVLTVEKNSDGTATTLKFTNGVTINSKLENADGSTSYTVTKGGKTYPFTANADGTYTYVDDSDAQNIKTYKVAVVPGSLTYEVKVQVGDITTTDNEITSQGSYEITGDNGSIINDLLSGKLSVVETADGLNTTLIARDSSALTNDGKGNYTYTDSNKTYNFTKSGNVYTYKDESGVTYEVTVEPGQLNKIYNINIEASDGVFYIDENGTGTLSLKMPNGYTITQNADNSKFTESFDVNYNEPSDSTQITGPYKTTVTIANKNDSETYHTDDFNNTIGGYNRITANSNGTYTLAPITNGNIQYNITIKPGAVISDTRVPVTIKVNDGTVTDGTFTGDGYSVTNTNIESLLLNKLKVVRENNQTTVKFTDEISKLITDNHDGTFTYKEGTNTYNFTKNADGTFTYAVENTNGEIIEYEVSIDTGDILTVNNKDVTINVNDGTITDGTNFEGTGYTVDNNVIKNLLKDNLTVTTTSDKKNTTVTVTNTDNLHSEDGKLTYLAADGNTYTFTKTADNQYLYSVTDGNTTTNYNVTVVEGDITNKNNIPVTINVNSGVVNNDGVLTVTSTDGKDYTIDNTSIGNLLTDVLTVDKTSDGTATTLKFNDGVTVDSKTKNIDGTTTYKVTKGGTQYEFTQNTDGTYTYVDDSDSSNVQIYNVTVDPGSLTYEVKVQVGDMTTTDNKVTSSGGYNITGDNGSIINDLLSGKLSVVETADGLNTTLIARDSSALTNDGKGNYTYTDSNKTYNFTKSGNVYTYKDESGVTYEVTVEPGQLNKIYNINIEVSDGVFYINQDGEGNISLNMQNGYTITKNANNSQFTENFNVNYNEPLVTPGDTTQVTGPYTTTVTVANKNNSETYNTNDFDTTVGGYNNIKVNEDGTYTLAPITNGNIQYNITIKPGAVISDTRVPVTIKVNDGTVTDGKTFTDNGYSVNNTDIENILKDKIEVVNIDGKTTVKFKEDVEKYITSNDDGSSTYDDGTNTYNFTKNTDGTFTYEIENPKGETINYVVSIDTGNISNENNTNVTIKVNDGTIVDGEFTGNGYTVDNDVIKNLLNGNIEVTPTDDNKNTTITIDKVSNFTKTDDNKYLYSVTDGNTTTNYTVTIVDGNISTTNNIPVTINVKEGKITDGIFEDGGYTVDNPTIENILKDKIEVVNVDGKTTVKFKEDVEKYITPNDDGSSTYNDGTNIYTFTQNDDGTFTYRINNPNDELIIYTVSINSGGISNYINNEVNLKVGDGTLKNNTFTDNSYTIDNDVIGNLLSGELTVTYDRFRRTTNVEFSNSKRLTTNGNNYSYFKNGRFYSFTKNSDGTFNYSVKNGDTTTIYTINITPGKLTIENIVPTPVTPTETTPVTTPKNTESADAPPTNPTTPSTPSTPSTPTTTTTPTSTPTIPSTPSTPSTPTTPTTTPTTPTVNEPTDEPTPLTEEPTPIVDEPTPEPTPLTDEPTPIVDEPTPEPAPLTDEPKPEVTPLTNEPETEPDEVETPIEDYELRNSNIEEFPEEKGDYIDLDSQDHILIERTDTNEAIEDIDVIPEEFSEASDRNIVDNNSANKISESTKTGNTSTPNSKVTSANRTSDNNQTSKSDSNNSSTGFKLKSITEKDSITTGDNKSSSEEKTSSDNTTSEKSSSENSTTTLENNDGNLGAIESGRSDSSKETDSEQTSKDSQESNSENLSSTENTTENNSDDDEDDKKSTDSDEEKEK